MPSVIAVRFPGALRDTGASVVVTTTAAVTVAVNSASSVAPSESVTRAVTE